MVVKGFLGVLGRLQNGARTRGGERPQNLVAGERAISRVKTPVGAVFGCFQGGLVGFSTVVWGPVGGHQKALFPLKWGLGGR